MLVYESSSGKKPKHVSYGVDQDRAWVNKIVLKSRLYYVQIVSFNSFLYQKEFLQRILYFFI